MAKRLRKKSIAEEMRDRATGNNQTYTVEERKDVAIPKQDMTPTPTLQDRINKHYIENMQNLANTTMNMVTNTVKRNPIVNSFMAGFNTGKNVELPQNQVKTIQNAVKKDLQTNTQDKRNPYTIMQDRNNQKKQEEEGHKKDVNYKPYQLPQAQEMVNKNQQEIDERKKNEEAQGLLSQVQNRTLPQAQKQEEVKKPTLTESIQEYLRTGDIRKSAGNYFKSQFEGGKQGVLEYGQYYNETLPSKMEGDSWTKRKSEEQYRAKEYREGLLNDVKQNPDNYSKEQKSFIKNQQEFTEKYGDNFYEAYKNESKDKVNKMIEEAPTEIDRKLIEIGQSNGQSAVGAGLGMLSTGLPTSGGSVLNNISNAFVNGLPSGMYFFGSSAQSYYDAAKEMGMAESDAWKYGNFMGAWEVASESLIAANRVDQVNRVLTGKNIGKTGMKFLGSQAVENAFQEALSEPIDNMTKSMLNYSYLNEGQLGERMLESGMIGAISALLMDSPTATFSTARDIVDIYNKSVEKIGKKATIEKMQKGAETYYAQILSEINNGLGNDAYEMMRNQNIQEENELSRLLPGQYENQQEIDRTRDEKLKAITEDMTEGDKTAFLIQNSNLSQEEKDSLSRVARRLNVSAEQIDDLLKFNEEQNKIRSENNELEQMIDNSNLTKAQIGEVFAQKSFEEAKNKINELTEENNANQEAIKTLGLNISEENKEGNILYKEKQNIEINDSDTLESSYKKYFGENETTLYKRLKGLEKIGNDRGIKTVFDAQYFKDSEGNLRTGVEAAYTTKNGQKYIVVNPYATTGKVLSQVVAHELTHDVLSYDNKDSQELIKGVRDFYNSKKLENGTTELDRIESNLKELYGDSYNEEELIAKTMENLFASQDSLNELANSKPNIFTRIYRSLVGMYAKITGSEKAYLKKMKLDMELAWKNSNNKGSLQDAAKYSFGGVNAKTANIGTLKQAKELKKQGLSNEEIHKQTGWFEGNEGKWRFEIDNSEDLVQLELEGDIKDWERLHAKSKLDENNKKIEYHQKRLEKLTPGTEQYNKAKGFIDKYTNENKGLQSIVGNTKVKISSKNLNNYYGNSLKDEYPITDILKADKLFEAYPQLKDLKIRFDTTRGKDGTIAFVENIYDETTGKLKPANNYIYITKYGMDTINNGGDYDLKKTLLHELQHKIQNIEDFSRGSSWQEWYKNKTNDIRNRLYDITSKYIDKELKKNNAPYIWNVEDDVIRNDLYKMERLADNSIRQYIENPEDFELNYVQKRGLETTLGEKETNKFYKILGELKDYRTNGKALEYYKNTAGEIESREVEKRVNMTPDERAKKLPFIKDKNTVYSETMSKKPGNQANIKYSIEDSQGRKLTKEQQEYFKDSKVRDKDGNLLEVYHGTPTGGFTVYDNSKLGSTTGALDSGLGIHFTNNPDMASIYKDYVSDEALNGELKKLYEKYGKDFDPTEEFNREKVNFDREHSEEIAEIRERLYKEQEGKGEVKKQYINITKPLSVFADYGIDNKQLADDWVYALTGSTDITDTTDYYEDNEEFLDAIQSNWNNELAEAKDELATPEAKERLQELGYDGLILPLQNTDVAGLAALKTQGGEEFKDIQLDGNEYIVFNSNQAKNIDNTNPTSNPDIRYSIETTTDNNGNQLSKGQREYFNGSKAVDENGNLVKVFHTTTGYGTQFTEFNPVGTVGYKFAGQTVNYFTDSRDMSTSYADGVKVEQANTKKLNTLEEARDFVKGRYEITKEKDGSYSINNIKLREIFDNVDAWFSKLTEQEKDIFKRTVNKSRTEVYENIIKPNEISPYEKVYQQYINLISGTGNQNIIGVLPTSIPDLIDQYVNGKEIKTSIMKYKTEKELLRNLPNAVSNFAKRQYQGYVKLTNPFVVDGKGNLWKFVEKIDSETIKQQDEVYNSLTEDDRKNLIQVALNTESGMYGFENTIDKRADIFFNALKNTWVNGKEIAEKLETIWTPQDKAHIYNFIKTGFDESQVSRNYSYSTNEIVYKVLDMNKNGADYDGVIIKNIVDYGSNYAEDYNKPASVYVTFNSNQFKAADNKNPTNDPDIRYSEQTETADDIINRLLEKYKPDISNEPKLPGIPKNLPKDYIMELGNKIEQMSIPDDKKLELYNLANTNDWNEESYNNFITDLDAIEQDFKNQQQRDRFTTKVYNDPDRAKLITRKHNEFNKDYHYNDTLVDEIDSLLPRNNNGNRLVREWKNFARELGKRLALDNYTPDEVEDIAVKSYYDLLPTKNLTRYDKNSISKKAPREKLYANDWVNSVYEGLNEAGYDATRFSITDNGQNNEQVNQPVLPEQQTPQLPQAVELPNAEDDKQAIKNKTLNPTQISNLRLEDASTTPILPDKKYKKGDKQSQFVSNINDKVGFLTDEEKQAITSDENVQYYASVTNAETMAKAYKDLQENGRAETENWYAKKSEEATAEDVAKGWILLKQYKDSGNTQGMVNVAKKLRDMGSKTAQTLQAYNILSRLTPEGMVAYTQGELQDAYNEMIKGKSKKWIDQHKGDFDLSQEEIAFIMDTMQNLPPENPDTNNYERKVALGQIQKLFTDKIPADGNGIKAWMRISMLFNPKTQVRNVGGNAAVIPVNMFSDFLGSKADKLISKYTGVRTLGNPNVKSYLKGMKDGFYQSYNDFRLGINTRDLENNKFEFGDGKAFKNKGIGKALNRVDNILNFVMDFGDRGFSQAAFVNSINNQMVLNNVTQPTQEMIDIATQEALSRTWNDSNDYTKFVLGVRSLLNKAGLKKFGIDYGLGDVLIPFAKTPANLTKAIVDYSPVGLASSILDIKGLKNAIETGQITPKMQHEFVDRLGKGLAGTLLYVAGYALAKAGITSGEPDDDKDVKNFMRNSLGIAPYSIKIGDKTFTYDWSQPIATPLAIMANYEKMNKDNPDAKMIDKALGAIDIGSNQLLEQSFMESINEIFNGNGTVTERVQKAIFDLPARAIPTFSKQVADLVDGTQRTTFEYGNPTQSAINSVKAKLPGLSKTLTPSIDTLGNEIQKYGGENNWFNVFFNPANMNKGEKTKAGQEIYDVYMATGDTTVFPVTAPYYVNRDSGKITMDSKQRARYQKISGDYAEQTINKLLNDPDYNKLEPDDKAEIISKVVTDSKERANKDVLNITNKSSDLDVIDKIGADYYTFKLSTKGMKEDVEMDKVLKNKSYSNKNKQELYASEINSKDKAFSGLKQINSNFDMDSYLDYKINIGTFKGDDKKEQILDYLSGLDMNYDEKLYLYGQNYKLNTSELQDLENELLNKMTTEQAQEVLNTLKYNK